MNAEAEMVNGVPDGIVADRRVDAGPGLAQAEDPVAEAYRTHYPLLAFLGTQRFHLPEQDVQQVIHEVFVAFLRDRARVNDVRAWLVGAMCNRCRLYWRSRSREGAAFDAADADQVWDAADVSARVDLATALARLTGRCREVLRLRFEEDYSAEALAAHFMTTVAYARKMVYKCATEVRSFLQPSRRRP